MSGVSPARLRARDVQLAVRVEVLTVVWMVIEAVVSISAGVIAGSLLLTAFGLDSLIELVSGGILLWRLVVETRSRGGDGSGSGGTRMEQMERVEHAEQRAAWVVAVALALLCLYVLASAIYGLFTQAKPEASAVGIVVAVAAVLVMPWLGITKRRLATRLHSGALRGDAAESFTCAYMAATVLVGLVLNAALAWWWAEYLAALVFLVWLIGETREALSEVRGEHGGES